MSGRKRPARHDPSDPMHWDKEQYIHHLKERGISVKSTWRLDMIRQLYFENHKITPQSEGEVPQDTININDNTSTEPSKEQNEMETQVQQTNQNSGATHTEKLLKETTCALKTATEALSSMSSMVAGILQSNGVTGRVNTGSTPNQKSNFDLSTAFHSSYRAATHLNPCNVEQTFRRQVDTSKGIVYSEDLPKLDYVSPILQSQILEDVPESSTGSRCPSDNLSSLLARNVELTNTVSCLLKSSIAPRTRTQYECGYSAYITFLSMTGVLWINSYMPR
jgi:hypothetical protein